MTQKNIDKGLVLGKNKYVRLRLQSVGNQSVNASDAQSED